MSKAPEVCLYCDKHGNPKNGGSGPCGFCVDGKPLDTQEDWDASWGKILDKTQEDWARLAQELLAKREEVLEDLHERKTDRKDDSTD